MSITKRLIGRRGERIYINGIEGRGFISCLDPDDASVHRQHLAPGIADNAKYRLICCNEDLAEGDIVTAGGCRYIILRTEPVRISNRFSHCECVLKKSEE